MRMPSESGPTGATSLEWGDMIRGCSHRIIALDRCMEAIWLASKKKQRLKQQRRRHKQLAKRRASARVVEVLARSHECIARGDWDKAGAILGAFEDDHPGSAEIRRLLLDVYHEQRDYARYCSTCRQLVDERPAEPLLQLMLAGGYLNNAQMACALRLFRRIVERWPDDPLTDGARQMIAQLEPAVTDLLGGLPFAGDDAIESACLHEEVIAALAAGDYARAVTCGERLLARCPNFAPAINNLSEVYFHTGQTTKAFALAQQVLEQQPDNFQALANLARFLLLGGRPREAQQICERLRASHSDRPDSWAKKAETLSFFGDDQGVLDALGGAERSDCVAQGTPEVALLCHFAAVASARRGDRRRASRYWRRALSIRPSFNPAVKNLEDLRGPVEDRHGPWPFSLSSWLVRRTFEDAAALFDNPRARQSEAEIAKAGSRFAGSHPEVVSLVPALLDRGDPLGREFAWRMAILLRTPDMLEALRVFCLGQRGPDTMRLQTANFLCEEGALSSGSVRLWVDGTWQDLQLFGFVVTTEPMHTSHNAQVERLAYDAIQAMHRDDGVAAETLLKKALAIEGDAPDLWNNLGMAYQIQDRHVESLQLIREIHRRWPDYFFGRIGMANLAMKEGDVGAAENYLEPLRQRRRLHITEFTALAVTSIQLALRKRQRDAARSWLRMWQELAPDDPRLQEFEILCSSRQWKKSSRFRPR
jgi:tetratricopeptide (TPR) repeat protein